MKIPQLKKKLDIKNYHGYQLKDNYSWVDQPNILEVLKNPKQLLPDVRTYIEENNQLTENYFSDTKNLQKKIFKEIKSKIKLNDTSLKFKDKKYFYWSKTETKGNYRKHLRQIIGGSKPKEIYFDGDVEKKKHGSEYFGIGSISVSRSDKLLAYSLDLKGSEYFTIYVRNILTKKNLIDQIQNTGGSILWSLDSKSFFYTKLDKFHRPREIYKHILGTDIKKDILIFKEKDKTFTCSISLTSDKNFFIISTSDHVTTEEYFFNSKAKKN